MEELAELRMSFELYPKELKFCQSSLSKNLKGGNRALIEPWLQFINFVWAYLIKFQGRVSRAQIELRTLSNNFAKVYSEMVWERISRITTKLGMLAQRVRQQTKMQNSRQSTEYKRGAKRKILFYKIIQLQDWSSFIIENLLSIRLFG